MQFTLTSEQISKVDTALAALDAVSCLCAQVPVGEAMENVNAHNFAVLLDLIISEIRDGTNSAVQVPTNQAARPSEKRLAP